MAWTTDGHVKGKDRNGNKYYRARVWDQAGRSRVLRRRWRTATAAEVWGVAIAMRYERLLEAAQVLAALAATADLEMVGVPGEAGR